MCNNQNGDTENAVCCDNGAGCLRTCKLFVHHRSCHMPEFGDIEIIEIILISYPHAWTVPYCTLGPSPLLLYAGK